MFRLGVVFLGPVFVLHLLLRDGLRGALWAGSYACATESGVCSLFIYALSACPCWASWGEAAAAFAVTGVLGCGLAAERAHFCCRFFRLGWTRLGFRSTAAAVPFRHGTWVSGFTYSASRVGIVVRGPGRAVVRLRSVPRTGQAGEVCVPHVSESVAMLRPVVLRAVPRGVGGLRGWQGGVG